MVVSTSNALSDILIRSKSRSSSIPISQRPRLDHVIDDGVLPQLGLAYLGQLVHSVLVPQHATGHAYRADGWKAAEVDPYADRHLANLRLADYRLHLAPVTYVARVQAEAVHTALQRLEGKLVVEVDVGDDGDVGLALDLRKSKGRVHVRHGAPRDLTARLLHLADLENGRLDVARVGLCHRLHDDGCVSADLYASDFDLLRYPSRYHVPPPLRRTGRPFGSPCALGMGGYLRKLSPLTILAMSE